MTDTNDSPKWFIDENIPGVGDRPAWLPDKFKTVADMAKSNAELEKKLGSAPDEYDFSKSKYIKSDYAHVQELKQLAKEKRVPQEVMDKMLNSFDKYMDEHSVNEEAEMKKLGDNAQERIVTLDNWAKANLSKDSYEALSGIKTANAIKAIEELRGKIMSDNPQIPTGNTGDINKAPSVNDIQQEISTNLQKYKTDTNYRNDLQKRLEIAAKSSNVYVDKVGA